MYHCLILLYYQIKFIITFICFFAPLSEKKLFSKWCVTCLFFLNFGLFRLHIVCPLPDEFVILLLTMQPFYKITIMALIQNLRIWFLNILSRSFLDILTIISNSCTIAPSSFQFARKRNGFHNWLNGLSQRQCNILLNVPHPVTFSSFGHLMTDLTHLLFSFQLPHCPQSLTRNIERVHALKYFKQIIDIAGFFLFSLMSYSHLSC